MRLFQRTFVKTQSLRDGPDRFVLSDDAAAEFCFSLRKPIAGIDPFEAMK